MSRMLDVYLQDKLVGCLEQTDSGDLAFAYNADYLKAASYGISLSMPLSAESYKGAQVKAFFSGLLPEESVRDRLAKYLRLSENNLFALLEAVGGDCAGALALYPHGNQPPKASNDVEVFDEIIAIIEERAKRLIE